MTMPHSAPHHRARHSPPRAGSAARGYDYRWQQYRISFLHTHPVCSRCEEAAIVVDHIVPHRGDVDLFWDEENHQPLCKPCHDKKTATEDSQWV